MTDKLYDPLGKPVVLSQFRELTYILYYPEKVVKELNDPSLIIPKDYRFISTSKGSLISSAWDNYNAAIAKDPFRKLLYEHYTEAIRKLMYMYIIDEIGYEKEIRAIHEMGYKINVYEGPHTLLYVDRYHHIENTYFTIVDQKLVSYHKNDWSALCSTYIKNGPTH